MSRQSDAAAESLPGHEDFSSPRGPPVCLRRGPRALTRREARGPPCPQLLGSCCTHRAPRAGSQTMPMPGPAALRGLDTQRPRGPCAPSHPPCPAHGSQQGLREGPARALFSCRQPAAGLSTGLGVLPNPRAADPGPPHTASSMGVSLLVSRPLAQKKEPRHTALVPVGAALQGVLPPWTCRAAAQHAASGTAQC